MASTASASPLLFPPTPCTGLVLTFCIPLQSTGLAWWTETRPAGSSASYRNCGAPFPGTALLSATLPSAAVCYMDESSLAAFASLVNAAQLTTEIAGIWSTVANHHSPLLPPVEVPEKVPARRTASVGSDARRVSAPRRLPGEQDPAHNTRLRRQLPWGHGAGRQVQQHQGQPRTLQRLVDRVEERGLRGHVRVQRILRRRRGRTAWGSVSFETPHYGGTQVRFCESQRPGRRLSFRLMEAGGAGADSLITAAFERLFLTAADRWHGEIKGRHWGEPRRGALGGERRRGGLGDRGRRRGLGDRGRRGGLGDRRRRGLGERRRGAVRATTRSRRATSRSSGATSRNRRATSRNRRAPSRSAGGSPPMRTARQYVARSGPKRSPREKPIRQPALVARGVDIVLGRAAADAGRSARIY